MKAESSLFKLIAGLNESEKKHFKVYVKQQVQNSNKGYLKLFDAINYLVLHKRPYDEDQLKRKLINEPWINNFSGTKNYLFNLIIESHRTYEGFEKASKKIKKLLIDAEFLIDKELHDKAWTILDKAEVLCDEYENNILALEIYFKRSTIIINVSSLVKDISTFKTVDFKARSAIQKINNYFLYRLQIMFLNARALKRSKYSAPGRVNTKLFSIEEKKLIIKVEPETFFAKKLLLYALFNNHAKLGNYAESFKSIEAILAHYKQYPHFIDQDLKGYVFTYHDYINACTNFNHKRKLDDAITQLKKIMLTHERELSYFSIDFLNNGILMSEALMLINCGAFNEATNKMKLYERSKVDSWTPLAISSLYLLFVKCYSFFGNGNFEMALNTGDQILMQASKGYAQELFTSTKIIQLLIYYEKGDDDLILHGWKSSLHLIEKSGVKDPVEDIAMRFIKEHLSTKIKGSDGNKLLIKYRNELRTLLESSVGIFFLLQDFDLLSWFNSKINGSDFGEEVKLRSKKYAIALS